MELIIGLAVLLAAAGAVTVLVIVLRQRRAERERLRGEEMRALDERISERLGELVGKRRSRPDREPAAEPRSPATIEPQTIAEGPPPFARVPLADAQKPRPMRIGRARPQAVAGAGRTRGRLRRRDMLVALAVIALFVVVGSQVLGSRPSGGKGTPSPTGPSGAVPTGTSEPTRGSTPTPTGDIPTQSPLPTATLGGPTPTPLATPLVYVVRRGDTMSKIAEQFGVTLADLIAANPQIEDPSLIYAGNLITIPTSSVAPGASPTASAVP